MSVATGLARFDARLYGFAIRLASEEEEPECGSGLGGSWRRWERQ